MKFRAKHKKLFYVPGMTSLLLLPVLCLWFINSRNYCKEYHAVDVALSDSFFKFNYKNPLQSIPIYPKRTIEKFSFVDDFEGDKAQLKRVRERIRIMHKDNDSINAVKMFFGKKMQYQTYIDILDALAIEKVPSYVVNSNFIYVAYFPPKHERHSLELTPIFKCGFGVENEEFFAEREITRQHELFLKNIKQFLQIPLGLLGIIALNLFMLIKFNRNRIYNQKSYI